MQEFKIDGTYINSNGEQQSIDGLLVLKEKEHVISFEEFVGSCQNEDIKGTRQMIDNEALLFLYEINGSHYNRSYALRKTERPNEIHGDYKGIRNDHGDKTNFRDINITLTPKG